MDDIEVVRRLDRHITRARAFKEAVDRLESWKFINASEEIRHLYNAEMASFDELWEKHRSAHQPTPPEAL